MGPQLKVAQHTETAGLCKRTASRFPAASSWQVGQVPGHLAVGCDEHCELCLTARSRTFVCFRRQPRSSSCIRSKFATGSGIPASTTLFPGRENVGLAAEWSRTLPDVAARVYTALPMYRHLKPLLPWLVFDEHLRTGDTQDAIPNPWVLPAVECSPPHTLASSTGSAGCCKNARDRRPSAS